MSHHQVARFTGGTKLDVPSSGGAYYRWLAINVPSSGGSCYRSLAIGCPIIRWRAPPVARNWMSHHQAARTIGGFQFDVPSLGGVYYRWLALECFYQAVRITNS
ncbi:hypothetical protein AVEN_80811-1 [Araneus ventricosus]|uniref:Uncharacterized protein n=1 Tax=Araneus ventricosus TaxID=182803 RepID=A0A4Y2JXB4_ARAVE|nr:hypothetical protein AVEN_80811-1 [Araneus ventricosus]